MALEIDIKNKMEQENIRIREQSRRNAKLKAEAVKVRNEELQKQKELLERKENQATADRDRKERDDNRAAFIAGEQAKSLQRLDELFKNFRPGSVTPYEEVTRRPIHVLDPIGNRPDFYQSTKVESSETSETSDKYTEALKTLKKRGMTIFDLGYESELKTLVNR